MTAKRFPTLNDLREELLRADIEYAAAEFITDTTRMRRERERWSIEVERIRAEIERRGERWSGVWKRSL
jgi:signal recognition particle GTPase